ncbi:hypothetical protein D3C76_870710 [compost metagenome]
MVLTGTRIEADIQLLHAQLTASDHHRAFTAHQPTIDSFVEQQAGGLALVIQALMHLGVVYLDDRLVDLDGMRHPDGFREKADQAAADVGLAGACGAVNHDGAPGIQRYAQLVEHALREHYASEGLVHVLRTDAAMVDGLQLEQLTIGLHRKRRRADIATARQCIAGGGATALGQAVAQHLPPALHTNLTQYFDTAILAQKSQHFFYHCTGQRQALDQARQVQRAGVVQVLAQQITEKAFRQASLTNCTWLRCQALHCVLVTGAGTTVSECVHY